MNMQTLLSNVTAMVTEAIEWVQMFVNCITDNPLLLAFVVVAFVGLGVGLIKRLIRL